LLLKWTRLWTWTPQPLRLRSSQRRLLYTWGLCPWPWRTCPLHNIETHYGMHTHEVAVTNLRWDNLMLVILCISNNNLTIHVRYVRGETMLIRCCFAIIVMMDTIYSTSSRSSLKFPPAFGNVHHVLLQHLDFYLDHAMFFLAHV
jgi:hypothetical protein